MLLDTACQIPDKKKCLFDELNSSGGRGVFVLGCNIYSRRVAERFDVEGFIDDFTSESSYSEKPIVRMDKVPKDCIVISCSTEKPLTAWVRLQQHGITRILDYFALSNFNRELFPIILHCGSNLQDIGAHREKYEWLYGRLADETSRRIFKKIINFRYFMNLDCLRGFKNDVEGQYFDDCIVFGANEVFVDGGGYDGDTSLRFAQRCGKHKAIYYFEPAPDLMVKSKEKLKGLDTVHFIEKGLYRENCTLCFDATRGVGNRLSDEGGTKIEVVRLDDEVKEKVTYIKLDLEGAEFDAICGARSHIEADRPKFAVGVYHAQHDFWRVPEEILRITDAYDLYFRHYSESVSESVLYFIPR